MVDLKAKPFNLTDKQIDWVEKTISSMTLDEKIKQLFIHLTGASEEEAVKAEAEKMQMGGIRFNPGTPEAMWNMNHNFHKFSKIPVLSAVNTEAGGNGAARGGTMVGSEMKVAATGDPQYAYKLGQICGRETRATGSNWAFAPITDLVLNWHNPGIAVRGWGNDPDQILELSKLYFKGMQESNIACTMKHFPGDGYDERDPHIATAVNGLSCEDWDATYGKVYKGMIEAGIHAVMPGHIMQPAYQRYFSPDTKDEDIKPATVCKELLTDLLRGKLGFNGLIVTDASHMVGLTGRTKRSEMVPQAIAAGCDMFLFYNDFEEDVAFMRAGYDNGIITEERLSDALHRIMGLKAVVGLDQMCEENFPKKEGLSIIGCAEHQAVAKEVADKGITLVKSTQNIYPVTPEKYKRIMIVPVGPEPSPIVARAGMGADGTKLYKDLKEKFEAKGFEVTIYKDPLKLIMEVMKENPGASMADLMKKATGGKGVYGTKQSIAALTDNYDLVICVANVSATMRTTQRIEWAISKGGWDNPWYVNEIPTVFVSFNCPFHMFDVPQVKNFINCYDAQGITIDALIEKFMGNSEFTGKSTVDAFCGTFDSRF